MASLHTNPRGKSPHIGNHPANQMNSEIQKEDQIIYRSKPWLKFSWVSLCMSWLLLILSMAIWIGSAIYLDSKAGDGNIVPLADRRLWDSAIVFSFILTSISAIVCFWCCYKSNVLLKTSLLQTILMCVAAAIPFLISSGLILLILIIVFAFDGLDRGV